MKDKYKRFDCIKELMELTFFENEINEKNWLKIVQTGEFELWDYGRGFLAVEAYVIQEYVGGDIGFSEKYQVRIYFSNIDDGDAGAWSQPMTLEEANELADKVAKEVFKDMVALPTMEELNKQLRNYKLYITHE